MQTSGEPKQIRIPVDVNDIKELQDGFVVDPEDAVVDHLCVIWVKVQGSFHLGCPVLDVTIREVSFPAHVRPRVLQQQHASVEHLQRAIMGTLNNPAIFSNTASHVPCVCQAQRTHALIQAPLARLQRPT